MVDKHGCAVMRYAILFLLLITQLAVFAQEEEEDKGVTCNSYHNRINRYRSRCFYADGKKRSRGNCDVFRVLHSIVWDEQGHVIKRARQYPFTSTSYTYVSREMQYNGNGKLTRYEYRKEAVACFGGGLIREKIIEYDEQGRIKTRTVKRRRDLNKEKVKALF